MCKSHIPQVQAHSYGRLQDANLTHYQQPGSDSMLWTGNAKHMREGERREREAEGNGERGASHITKHM